MRCCILYSLYIIVLSIGHYTSFHYRPSSCQSLMHIQQQLLIEWRIDSTLRSVTNSIISDDNLMYDGDDIDIDGTNYDNINSVTAYDKNSYKDRSIRYVARVCYDGTHFKGFQEQDPKIRTVQGTLSRALSSRYSNKYLLRVTGASRTDQGVHARGQCIHFDLPYEKEINDIAQFQHSFNRMLPPDLKIHNMSVAPVPNNPSYPFHATISSTGKRYTYRFCINDHVDPMRRLYCSHFYYPFDMQLFKHCLTQFVGTHDFSAYSNQIDRETKRLSEVYNISLRTVRTVNDIEVIDEGDGYYRVEFHLQSALYRMVRNIVGSSLYVAGGQMPLSTLQQLLRPGCNSRDNPAKSAPAHGLTLEHVCYDSY